MSQHRRDLGEDSCATRRLPLLLRLLVRGDVAEDPDALQVVRRIGSQLGLTRWRAASDCRSASQRLSGPRLNTDFAVEAIVGAFGERLEIHAAYAREVVEAMNLALFLGPAACGPRG